MFKHLLSFTLLILPFCNQADTLVHVAAYTVQKDTHYFQTRQLTGQVIKQHDANLSFEFAGKIDQILLDQGQSVRQGDVIARQNTEFLEIEQQKLAAHKQKALAQLAQAELEKNRLSKLDKQNYSAAAQLDQVKTNIAVIEAELAGLLANLSEVDLRIKKALLIAPFNGMLGQRFVSHGENVAAGTPIVRLIEDQHSQVSIGIPQALQSAVTDSMPITIAGQTVNGQALSKGASVNPRTQTLTMRFALPESLPVFAGQIAKLTLKQHHQQDGFWVPIDALADGVRGTWQIYQIKDNILNPIIVQLYYVENGYAFINAPLENGEQIVANGMHKLSANISVNVVELQPTKVL
ncbi:efflux RND transporter periplasmic adaptor subunit [Pseudoalteromonas ulvae]|uniref:Efflux transporter periplasmic adaptor subunit n=1 Tax=Pseudoalteromonas ulvae TaxID=107327 RepID=A0A244CNS7_PSEDV|nr:efflux RND transporter periplasmic adaptor subunit [Pseudoalteromonas ulvae]OUL57252.1 efflux transporter periplasmic adaptor subunit [Pseudoalteromonas ulvae]